MVYVTHLVIIIDNVGDCEAPLTSHMDYKSGHINPFIINITSYVIFIFLSGDS